MRYLMVLLLPTCALAQELPAEDRACIIAAVDRLPRVDAVRVEGSRVLTSQPAYQGHPYNAMAEIDVSVAGHKPTVFSATAIPW